MWDLIVSVSDHCLSFYFVMVILLIVKISSVQLGVYPFSKGLLYLLIRTLSSFLYFILVRDLFCFLIMLKKTFPRFISC